MENCFIKRTRPGFWPAAAKPTKDEELPEKEKPLKIIKRGSDKHGIMK